MASSGHLLESFNPCSHQTHEQLERLQEQLQSMEGERDHALQQLAMAQEKAEQHATALRNLQAVLEQFQRGTR